MFDFSPNCFQVSGIVVDYKKTLFRVDSNSEQYGQLKSEVSIDRPDVVNFMSVIWFSALLRIISAQQFNFFLIYTIF